MFDQVLINLIIWQPSRRVFFSPGRVILICCDSVQELEHGLALAFSNPCTCTYLCSLKAGAAAAAMDYMPPQFPTLPTESSDIFSLSDQVLSDRLEFIEEAG